MDSTFISKSFNSFEEFVTLFPDWELDFVQLSPGDFLANCNVYTDTSVRIVEIYLNKHLHHRGMSPNNDNYIFSVYHPDSALHCWRYIDCPKNNIVTFPKNKQLHSVSLPGLHRYFLMVTPELVADISRSIGLPLPDDFIKKGEVSICGEREIFTIQEKMLSIFKQLKHQQIKTEKPHVSLQDKSELISLFLQSLGNASEIAQKNKQIARATVIHKILDHVESDLSASRSIHELSKVANLSERTFRNFFYEIFSIAPKKYLKCFSLNAVRKELQQQDATRFKISDIAQMNGFFHMGQFSADYKELFNELPSDTLKNNWRN